MEFPSDFTELSYHAASICKLQLRACTGGVDWRNPYELLATWSQRLSDI